MDPNHPDVKDFRELVDYKWFKVVNFQWMGQDHYRVQPRGNGGVSSITVCRDGKFVMIRQRRPMFHAAQLEFVNGGVDKNETSEQAMEREIFEETGYRVHKIEKIVEASYDVSLALARVNYFWAVLENEPECKPQEMDLPGAQLVVLSKDELIEAMRTGEVHQHTTCNLLYALFLRRDPMLKELLG